MNSLRRQLKRLQSVQLILPVWRKVRGMLKNRSKKQQIKVIALTEHIGDIVAAEPVARYLRNRFEQDRLIWVVNCRYAELVKYNPHVDEVVQIKCLSEWIYMKCFLRLWHCVKVFDLHIPEKSCSRYLLPLYNRNSKQISYRNHYAFGSLLGAMSLIGELPVLKDTPRFYFPPDFKTSIQVPEHFIAIQTTSNEKVRDWEREKWKELILHYPSFHFIELGLHPVVEGCENCDTAFCGKISLLEVAWILSKADLFIGIDSAFAHFANALSIPGVVLLGKYHDFDVYMPYSGNYAEGRNAKIIHYKDVVSCLPVGQVIEAVDYFICGKGDA